MLKKKLHLPRFLLLCISTFPGKGCIFRIKWHPTPVLLPGESIPWTEGPGGLQSMGSQRGVKGEGLLLLFCSVWLCNPMDCNTPGFPVHHQLREFIQTHVYWVGHEMPSSHLIFFRPLLLLPPTRPGIRVFSNESTLHIRWPKYWSFSFSISISLSNEHPGLISFRMDWLDLLADEGNLKSLFQHHSSKASILWRSAVFTVQLSHPYMTTGKTTALTRWTFVGKVMSLPFNDAV